VAATGFISLLLIAPFILPLLPGVSPPARAMASLAALLLLRAALKAAERSGLPAVTALFFPVGLMLFIVTLWRSTLTALISRTVVWRGTAYPLGELVAACDTAAWRRFR